VVVDDVVRYFPAPIAESDNPQTAWQYVASKTRNYTFFLALGQEFYIDVAPSGRIERRLLAIRAFVNKE
jgi:cephalosporin hydroxylase